MGPQPTNHHPTFPALFTQKPLILTFHSSIASKFHQFQSSTMNHALVCRPPLSSGIGHGALGLRASKSQKSVKIARGVRCEVITVDEGNFEREVLRSDVPVLVDFWATWCGPCALVSKSMDALDEKYSGKLKVVKVETDPNPTLVQMYRVYGLPTLVMFREGEEVEGGRCEGAISLAKLEAMIAEAVPSLAAAKN